MNRRRWGWARGIVLGGTLVLLLACATARRGEPLTGPLKSADPAVARGEPVFLKHCQQCHPGGDAGVGPALNNKPLSGFMIRTQVRLGLGAMPRFKKSEISPTQLDDVVSYLKALRAQGKRPR